MENNENNQGKKFSVNSSEFSNDLDPDDVKLGKAGAITVLSGALLLTLLGVDLFTTNSFGPHEVFIGSITLTSGFVFIKKIIEKIRDAKRYEEMQINENKETEEKEEKKL